MHYLMASSVSAIRAGLHPEYKFLHSLHTSCMVTAMVQSMRLLILLLLLPVSALAAAPPPVAAIASAHPLATEAGHDILAQGGNAFDAAVAMAAVLGVVEPANSGLGGGGFWLLHRATDGFETVVDGRERAPLAARADMYLDKDGKVLPQLSLDGPLAAAIPGTPAALVHIARRYGRLPLAQSLAPAIRIAKNGFAVSARYQSMAERRSEALRVSPAAATIFLDGGFVPEPGYVLRQPELAATLKRIAARGRAGFYAGETAQRLVAGVRAAGGIWSLRDLQHYRVVERRPLRARYGDMTITSAPPPSSGGVVLAQMLNILDAYPLTSMPAVERQERIIQAMGLAYRERARHLGDPDFVAMDVPKLISPAYARSLRSDIAPRVNEDLRPTGTETTHFSVLDRAGNRVAVTLSLNTLFGSGFMPEGTGVLLNNEMDDFSAKPGAANTYGLIGSKANAIAPGKRPLSSMAPTFLETPDAVMILGTPGGSRIPTMVLLAALEFAQGRGGVQDWVAMPRFHHQYLPDVVEHEPGAFSADEARELAARGHALTLRAAGYGNMQAIVWYKKTKRVEAASDPRGEGRAVLGR